MFIIRKKFKFESAHILSSAFSKDCMNRLHGHSYIVEVFLKSKSLNKDGMVIDFGELNYLFKDEIDSWDHSCVVHAKDKRDFFIAVADKFTEFNPTAENMAKYFYDTFKEICPVIFKVRVHETANGYAEYYED